MTHKPKEPDLEQVKSLLRRLEEIPETGPAPGQPLPGSRAHGAQAKQEREFPKLAQRDGSNIIGLPTTTAGVTASPASPSLDDKRAVDAMRPAAIPPEAAPAQVTSAQSRPPQAGVAAPQPDLKPPVSLPSPTTLPSRGAPPTAGASRVRDAGPDDVDHGSSSTRWLIAGTLAAGICGALFVAWPHLPAKLKGSLTTAERATREAAKDFAAARSDRQEPPIVATDATLARGGVDGAGNKSDIAANSGAPAASPPIGRPVSGTVAGSTGALPAAFEAPVPGKTAMSGDVQRSSAVSAKQPAAAPPVTPSEVAPSRPVSPPVAVAGATAPSLASPAAKRALPDAEGLDEELLQRLILQGQQMLTQGHVASARLLFRRAADSGSAEAALALGDTFDPQRLQALGVRGIAGDVEQSIKWYEKADELGSAEAKGRLMALSGR